MSKSVKAPPPYRGIDDLEVIRRRANRNTIILILLILGILYSLRWLLWN